VLRISKRHEPVNLVHCPSCNRHEPFCYSRRYRPTPKNTLRGNPGCAVGPKTPTIAPRPGIRQRACRPRPRHSRSQSPPFPTLCTKCPRLRSLDPLRHPRSRAIVLPAAMSPPPSLGMHAAMAALPPHPLGVLMLRDSHDRALSR
jgi:hypothetical protein